MPTEYLLPCNCGEKTTVVPSQAGQNVTCQCGATLSVPKLREISLLELASSVIAKKSGKTGADSWNAGLGVAVATFLGLALISFGFCGYYIFLRSQIDTSITIDDQLRADNKYLESLTPAEVILGYTNTIEEGMGVRDNPPGWHIEKLWADWYESWATYTGVLGLSLLATAVLFLWLSRRVGTTY